MHRDAQLTPSHHPSAQILADLLIGDCSPGAALLVVRHVEACAQCAARVRAMGAPAAWPDEVGCTPAREVRPGVEVARVTGASGLGEMVLRVRAAAGVVLPLKAPAPVAELLVLEGGFAADGQPYTAGDFLSLEERPLGLATSDPGQGCAYLATCHDDSWQPE